MRCAADCSTPRRSRAHRWGLRAGAGAGSPATPTAPKPKPPGRAGPHRRHRRLLPRTCGGTHVARCSQVGAFRLLTEFVDRLQPLPRRSLHRP
nr:hypothetical protein [Streptomyces sp. ISID311]